MRTRVLQSITEIPAQDWNALGAGDYPFLRHEFLSTLEQHESATARTGWQPHHLLLEDGAGRLLAAAPLYLKSHSFGEFVFDFAWAEASHRLGRDYYPKLLNAVPFNPVTGPRLLATSAEARSHLAAAVRVQAETHALSSAHALFLNDTDRQAYADAGFLLRKDCQYQWYNPGFSDFEDYLGSLNARRRKEVRRERRKVAESGVNFAIRKASEVPDDLWPAIYHCYAITYQLRGQPPYMSEACLRGIAKRLDDVRMFLAWRDDRLMAMAYMLAAGDTLYGRHWGAVEDLPGLHFETCYYQGIEYCIRHGLKRFDAGAQGSHKLHRGFVPTATWSAHWLADARLRNAVAAYLERESAAIDEYINQMTGKYRRQETVQPSYPHKREPGQMSAGR